MRRLDESALEAGVDSVAYDGIGDERRLWGTGLLLWREHDLTRGGHCRRIEHQSGGMPARGKSKIAIE